MYAYYSGQKQALSSDDIAGIQSIYGAPQYDQFNSNGQSNGTYGNAVNVTSYMDANGQLAIGGLDITTGSQAEWFYVTVPSTTTGTMVATVQSSALSSLNPKVTVYTSALKPLGMVGSSNYGDTVSFTVSGVVPGQGYYIRASNNGGSSNGAFGLELNFGSMPQPPIPPPNTVVAPRPDLGGGGINQPVPIALAPLTNQLTNQLGGRVGDPPGLITLGSLTDYGEALTAAWVSTTLVTPTAPASPPQPDASGPLNPEAPSGPLGADVFQGPSSSAGDPNGAVAATPVATGSNYLANQAVDRAIDSWWRWA
jgi:hypothetical protein